jgi:hypothetical protein
MDRRWPLRPVDRPQPRLEQGEAEKPVPLDVQHRVLGRHGRVDPETVQAVPAGRLGERRHGVGMLRPVARQLLPVALQLTQDLGGQQHALLVQELVALLHQPPLVAKRQRRAAGRRKLTPVHRPHREPRGNG